MLMGERWQRATWAHANWAETAKIAVDFVEGRQWSAAEIEKMARQNRPTLQYNIIAPLVRLMIGYHANNKTDITFEPGDDSRSSEDIAEVLSRQMKSIAQNTGLEFVDAAVFLDGIITGRGFYRTELDFSNNDLGESKTVDQDPFATFVDPDANTYNLNETASFIQTSKMVSIDGIEAEFGLKVAEMLRPFTDGKTPISPVASLNVGEEVTPVRYFGMREDYSNDWWDSFYATMGDFVDVHRKSIRIIETEHHVTEERNVIIDLETGDKKVAPKHWNREKLEKIKLYGEMVNNPLLIQRRQVTDVHVTTMAGDLILYDQPSPYQTYSITGYFPYFRRGVTRGAVEDLLDPQRDKNKRRSSENEMVTKLSNGGWQYHENALDIAQERNLKNFGASPGFMMKWKGDKEPKQITPAAPPTAHERLEQKDDEDIRRISGINESALGELDRVQSGRAIEARQRQAVISIQMYMDNFKQSKTILGRKHLEIIQNHYTEARMFRVLGEDGKFTQTLINQMQVDPTSGIKRILNDVTIGKYTAVIDEQPLSATFANAQFEEMLTLLEKMGPAIGPFLPMFGDLIVDMSSLPRKAEWTERLQQAMGQMGMGGGPQPPGGGVPGNVGPAAGMTNAPALDTGMAAGGNIVPIQNAG